MSAEPLGSASRALLEAARSGLGPDAATVARMRSRITVATASATASTTAQTAALQVTAPSNLGKLGLFGLIAVAIVGITGARQLATPDQPQQIAAFESLESPAAIPHTAREPAPPHEPVVSQTAQTAQTVVLEAPGSAPPVRSGIARTRPTIDLAREVELVDRAMTALRRGNPAAAVVAVRLHAAETSGTGQLAEDAAAIEIEALCKLSDPAVTRRLAGFDARWPSSAQRARLSCR